MNSEIETTKHEDSDVASDFLEKIKSATIENAFTDVLSEVTADVLRKKIQEIREDVQEHVNSHDMISEVQKKIEVPTSKDGDFLYSSNKYRDKRSSGKKDTLPEKEFLERDSLLTDLFKIPHIRTVYNLFVMILIILLFKILASDIMESGTIRVSTDTILYSFEKFPTCIYIWSLMQASILGVYVAFNLWAYQRLRFLPKSFIRKFWDYGWLTVFMLYQILFIVFPTKAVIETNLSIACRAIVLLEQARMLMKNHAFVRSAASRFLSYKPHSETPQPSGPNFSQYLYFLFAPTLVYRDEYPRTKRIRWMVVIQNFTKVGVMIFYIAFIMDLVLPINSVFGTQPLEKKWFVKNMIDYSILPGIFLFFITHHLLLHAWMNAWAEMLRFADRLFYKDWWNSTTYHTFYRTWNVVVHDWLYTYIYKDMYEIVVPRNQVLAATAVFLTSAIVHEYILSFILGFFYPMLLIQFVAIGLPMFFVRKIISSNVFMLLTLSLSNGIMICLYSIECYARINCPLHSSYYLDLFIPRSWSC
ncbi:PREDICTED: sterol O-acyltransferase 1-like isoform X2 [Wasmannia auropunctata]|uniref:sterol O-acyltransferase 1-like isoform X2 n=1 Tax=Wasmannia auropunctata TaxID=64793 RepID=UPI0005EF3657|nr:PREDICTED: sterol O-acyltransferase 1-like isoform X2 [Wasmannia auropunctata]